MGNFGKFVMALVLCLVVAYAYPCETYTGVLTQVYDGSGAVVNTNGTMWDFEQVGPDTTFFFDNQAFDIEDQNVSFWSMDDGSCTFAIQYNIQDEIFRAEFEVQS